MLHLQLKHLKERYLITASPKLSTQTLPLQDLLILEKAETEHNALSFKWISASASLLIMDDVHAKSCFSLSKLLKLLSFSSSAAPGLMEFENA